MIHDVPFLPYWALILLLSGQYTQPAFTTIIHKEFLILQEFHKNHGIRRIWTLQIEVVPCRIAHSHTPQHKVDKEVLLGTVAVFCVMPQPLIGDCP